MNRCKASLLILCSLILLCVISLWTLRQQSAIYCRQIDQLEIIYRTGTTAEALAACQELGDTMEQYHNLIGLFVNGTELDEIRQIIASLTPMIQEHSVNTSAEIARLRLLVQNMYEEEFPEVWHIL